MKRIAWIDSARGIGIVLVVIGHALGGLIDSPLGRGQTGLRSAFLAIYTFHMPLFLLLSGLLVGERLGRGPARFVRGLVPTLVWPYFLWSALQFSVIYALGPLVNNPQGHYWTTILALPWEPQSQFWFLLALFWMHVSAALVVPRYGTEGLVLLALALKGLALSVAMPVAAKLVCNHMLFYALGVWLGHGGVARLVVERSAAWRALVLPGAALAAIAVIVLSISHLAVGVDFARAASPVIANIAWGPAALAAAVAGTLAAIGLASLPPLVSSGFLGRLGQLSMAIFILHVLFIAGTRILLVRFGGVHDPLPLLPLLIFVGLAGPLLAERVLRPLRWQRYLGF